MIYKLRSNPSRCSVI